MYKGTKINKADFSLETTQAGKQERNILNH